MRQSPTRSCWSSSDIDDLGTVGTVSVGSRLDRLDLGVSGPDMLGLPPVLGALLEGEEWVLGFRVALHVLPSGPAAAQVMMVQSWNDPDLWRSSCGGLADRLFFFAVDVFGVQFAFAAEGIVSFDPERCARCGSQRTWRAGRTGSWPTTGLSPGSGRSCVTKSWMAKSRSG